MATAGPGKMLRYEMTCPICLGYFADPVILECGHNFCRNCISRCWAEPGVHASCPQCRKVMKKNLKPNRPLANIVDILCVWGLPAKKEVAEKGMQCERHQEPLAFHFCMDHQSAFCMACSTSQEHKSHHVLPLEKAAREYKIYIHDHMEMFKGEKDSVLTSKAEEIKESQKMFKVIETYRRRTAAVFRQLHDFLEVQEKHMLDNVEEVEKEVRRKRDEHLAILSRKNSSLENAICEMEEIRQQPPNEFLQNIRRVLERLEVLDTCDNQVDFYPVLKWGLWECSDVIPFLEGVIATFKDFLVSGLLLKQANVILDPDTAHPCLLVSEDRKSVRMRDGVQDLPENPQRFDLYPFVLGCEGFKAGRHFWEVTVGHKGIWVVGVVSESVTRKDEVNFVPEEGIWGMGKWVDVYRTSTRHWEPPLALVEEPTRIRVILNYEGGQVAFFNADTAGMLYVYSDVFFAGETVLPFLFMIGEEPLTLSP